MDNTMRITIPWKPGMTVMLKDGRYELDESVVRFLAEHGVGFERIAGGFVLSHTPPDRNPSPFRRSCSSSGRGSDPTPTGRNTEP